jgi:hypothetical protein
VDVDDERVGPVERDRSNGETGATDGRPLMLGGMVYAKGLGTHAPSEVRYDLPAACTAFTAVIGVDNEVAAAGSVVFQVLVDGIPRYDSGVMAAGGRIENGERRSHPRNRTAADCDDGGRRRPRRPQRLGECTNTVS